MSNTRRLGLYRADQLFCHVFLVCVQEEQEGGERSADSTHTHTYTHVLQYSTVKSTMENVYNHLSSKDLDPQFLRCAVLAKKKCFSPFLGGRGGPIKLTPLIGEVRNHPRKLQTIFHNAKLKTQGVMGLKPKLQSINQKLCHFTKGNTNK